MSHTYREHFQHALVTGGAGFIGSHVVRRLLAEGIRVRCLVLPSDPAPALRGLDVEIVTGDITDPVSVRSALDGVDMLFHLAAIYALWLPRPEKMFDVNVLGTRVVLDEARAAGLKRVVYTSSIAAVGYLPGREISDERVGYNDWHIDNDYVLSKYIGELEALARNTPEFEVVVVNPSLPFGENDLAPTPTGRLIRDAMSGKVPFVAEGGFNAADVRDVAEGHLLASVKGVGGERYILGGHNVTYAEFAQAIARAAHTKAPKLVAPTRFVRMFAHLSELAAEHVTHKPPTMTPSSVDYMSGRFLWFSTDKAERELGYTKRALDDAVSSSVAWFAGQ